MQLRQNGHKKVTHKSLILGSVPEGRKAINPSLKYIFITFALGKLYR